MQPLNFVEQYYHTVALAQKKGGWHSQPPKGVKLPAVYTRKSKLSKARRLRLLEHFVAGTTVRAAAELVGVNRNTVNRFYLALRTIVV